MPSSAIEILIADALAASLKAATFTGPLNCSSAARRFVPEVEPTTAGSLQVSVVPGGLEVTNHTHGADLFEAEIHVVLSKRFSADSEIDDLIELRTQIVDAIRSDTLPKARPPLPTGAATMPTGVVWFGVSNATTFDRDSMTNARMFLADIAVTYRTALGKL